MAAQAWMTNRGKYLLATGGIVGATNLYLGLVAGAAVPTAMDTEAEVQDLNFVSELLALTGVDEPTGGWYSRQTLATITGTEDDTNNRVNVDSSDVTWTAATVGESIAGWFVAKEGGTDAQDQLCIVGTFDPVVPTNGSNLQATIADLLRVV